MIPLFLATDFDRAWPFLIPIAAMAIPIVAIVTNYCQRRDLLHAWHHQRMAALEKGIELPAVPPELANAFTDRQACAGPKKPESHLLAGLILMAVGGGVALLLHTMRSLTGFDFAVVGAVPGFIGVALLLYYSHIRSRPTPGA